MTQVILFHDGCQICQGISALMTATFAAQYQTFESVDLAAQKDQVLRARALGITRLPSLVIDGRVLRLDDHSSIEGHA